MSWWYRCLIRARMLFGRRGEIRHLDQELEFHIDCQIRENIAAGMSPGEARSLALRSFGNPGSLRDEIREAWSWSWLESLLRDAGYALRQLRRAPGFAVAAILTLALSVGIATAVFCVLDVVVLRPLPFAEPERIVSVLMNSRSGYQQPASWQSYLDERAQSREFTALAGYIDYFKSSVEAHDGTTVALETVNGTDNFFTVFGVHPLLGRTYLPGEEESGRNDVAVLGYDAWQRYFNGDRGVVNRPVKIDGRAYTIIGVMPPGFRFPLSSSDALYTPIHRTQRWMDGRGNHWLQTVGRLRDGSTVVRAQAEMAHVFSNVGRAYPDTDEGRTVHLEPLARTVSGKSRGPLWTLLAAVLAVVAIGCVNIAGLLLARGVRREREMAVRTAIGAQRARLVRQLLIESLLLALMGAAGGIFLAWTMLGLMRAFLMKALARGADVHLNPAVLATAIGLSILASILASLFPAVRLSAIEPSRAMKAGGGAGSTHSQHRLRSGFIVTQVALTMVLLVVASLLMRVVLHYSHLELGFDPSHILSVEIETSHDRYLNRNIIADFYQPLFRRVGAIPGVRAVGAVNMLPIKDFGSNGEIHIAGQPPNPPNREMLAEMRFVSTGYFDVFGLRPRSGRLLSPALDRPENPAGSIVVNEAFVRKFIPPNLDPTHQRIDDAAKEESWTHIVGVTGDVRQDLYEAPLAERDFLIDSLDPEDRSMLTGGMWLVLRFDRDPSFIVPALRAAIHEVDPTVPFIAPRVMTEVVSEALIFERMESWLFGIFASLALLLALVGLYGLVSHEVELGARDTGVRMALGATRRSVLQMVLGRVAWMVGAGTVAGILLALAARKLIGVIVYIDAQRESGGLVAIGLLLLISGLLAALLPAGRAASIDPVQSLRVD